MADAPLTPHLQSLLFQHRLEQRRQRMAPRQEPTLTTRVLDVPPEYVAPPQQSLARKPPELTPDYKGSELTERRHATDTGLLEVRERERGAMDRAKLTALMGIEELRFKTLAKKAGGGHSGGWEAYLKTATDRANAPENSALRETLDGVLHARYNSMTQMYRTRADASNIGFGSKAKGPSPSDIKLKAEDEAAVKKQAGAERVAAIGAGGRATTAVQRDKTLREVAAARLIAGEKPQDALVRNAMGGKDVRAVEGERLRADGGASGPVLIGTTPDGKKVYRLPDGSQAVEE